MVTSSPANLDITLLLFLYVLVRCSSSSMSMKYFVWMGTWLRKFWAHSQQQHAQNAVRYIHPANPHTRNL